ncbi:MAG: peptide ABC transporter permease [Alkalinema sp. CACIAM 70d]|nr:MAG: peptide ABC transporter permease [Alkalinema sp. CACIAM 70d]
MILRSALSQLCILATSYLAGCLLMTAAARAQTSLPKPSTDRDRFNQPLPTPQPLPSVQPTLPTPTPTPAPSTPAPAITIPVRKIVIQGSTIFTDRDWEPLIKTVEGRSVTFEELRSLVDQMTQKYLDRGYITSRAVLEEQTITDGIVKVRVIEGSLEKVDIRGLENVKPAYVADRIRLGAKVPLNKDALEDQLRLLKLDPLFTNVEASIKPGTGVGQSILSVLVKEEPAFHGFVGADNLSPPSVGSDRIGAVLSYRNPTGWGDEVTASYYRSTQGGSNAFDFGYRLPLNPMNGTLQLRIAPSRSKIIDPDFSAFGIRSNNALYEISYRQPLSRSPRQEFALSLGLAFQDGQTFLFDNQPFPFGIGAEADGTTKTRVLKFGQDFVKREPFGAWAFRSQFSLGLNIFDATTNSGAVPDGQFFSWLGQIQRVQQIGPSNLLIAQLDLQLTPDTLLPSQQFVIGGGQSLRGYRQNARSGDNGVRFSLEDRIVVKRDAAGSPMIQLVPFFDMGAVWSRSDNPNKLTGETFLASIGLGLIWEPIPRMIVRADYARPLVQWSGKGNNAQDEGVHFSVGYSF